MTQSTMLVQYSSQSPSASSLKVSVYCWIYSNPGSYSHCEPLPTWVKPGIHEGEAEVELDDEVEEIAEEDELELDVDVAKLLELDEEEAGELVELDDEATELDDETTELDDETTELDELFVALELEDEMDELELELDMVDVVDWLETVAETVELVD